MAKKIVLAGACRTAIGTMGGALSSVPAVDLGSIVIKEALNRAGVPADQVDHVYMGCVIQAGLGQNVARQATIKAGLPIETTAVTVNVVCGSGLNCVNMAAQMIEAGDADIVVAGGMESMSRAPFALPNARFGYRMNNGVLVDTMIKDAGMRGKAKLIDGFIQKNVDEDKENFMNGRNRADGTNELEERLNQYIVSERNKAVSDLADDEQISAEVLNLYIKEYDYLQKEQPEIIQKALKEKHLGLIKTRKALTRIMERLRSIIKTFNWE